MIGRRAVLALLCIAVGLGGCGGLGGEPEIVATAAPRPMAGLEADWRPDIELGARVFAERCVDCHGAAGDGRGELALAGSVEPPLDMTDGALVAEKSPLDWFDIITKGRIENLMPPWEQALSEDERWAVALYSYSLAYAGELLARGERVWREGCGDCAMPSVIPPVYSDVDYGALLNRELFDGALTEAEAQAAVAYARMRSLAPGADGRSRRARAVSGGISGTVLQGTGGQLLPADTVVQLRYGSAEAGFRLAETTAADDGGFAFDAVPISSDFDYALGAVYEGRLFSQRYFPGQADAPQITIYAATHDPQAVSVGRIDLSIEPATLEDLGAGLYISQVITFRNRSDRIYTSGRGFDDGREASLLIQFPLGARLLSGDAEGRYVIIEGMESLPDSVIDTRPALPGEVHAARLDYWLAYAGAARFEQAFNNPVDAAVTLSLSDGLRLESDWLLPQEAAGANQRKYIGDLRMLSEPTLSFGISGDPFATSSDDGLVVTSETLPALLLLGIALAGALLGGFGWMRRRKGGGASDIDGLAGELARLEDEHDQGRINHDLYHRRRRDLKAKLAAIMERRDE